MTLLTQTLFSPKALKPKEALLLADALRPVAADLEELHVRLPRLLPCKTQAAAAITAHVFAGKGKLIRPALFFLACKMLGYRGEQLFPIAAVCEFVHTASLLHDDVVDNSSTRRNKPTANHIWGDESAVLVGDLIYATASELMAGTGKLEIVTTFARAIFQMSEGELLQLENLFSLDILESIYFDILSGKTAVLMGAACKAAGILAEVNPTQKQALNDFGYSLGMAFQLIDDALDYCGNDSKLGKAVLSDLREGKITLPVILLKGLATASELELVRSTLQKPSITTHDAETVAALIAHYNTAAIVMQKAQNHTQTAITALQENFPATAERRHLESLAQSLLHRLH